jgi:hypothetical protein
MFGFHEMDVLAEALDENNEVIFDLPQLSLYKGANGNSSDVTWVAPRPMTIGAVRLLFKQHPSQPFLLFKPAPVVDVLTAESVTIEIPLINYSDREP